MNKARVFWDKRSVVLSVSNSVSNEIAVFIFKDIGGNNLIRKLTVHGAIWPKTELVSYSLL
jgi:hypothetical protein